MSLGCVNSSPGGARRKTIRKPASFHFFNSNPKKAIQQKLSPLVPLLSILPPAVHPQPLFRMCTHPFAQLIV